MERRLCFLMVIIVSIFLTTFFPHPVQASGEGIPAGQSETTENISAGRIKTKAVKKLQQMTPEEVAELDRKLSEALILYYDNHYGQALPIFREIATKVETLNIMWWLGTSAMKTGNLTLAIESFRRMLYIDSDLHRVRLDLALALFTVGQYDEARQELMTVLKTNPPDAVRHNIDRLMAAIDRETKKLTGNIRFSQGFMYDTNVNAGPEEQQLKVSGGTIILDDDSVKVRDEALVTTMQAATLYDFGGRQGFMWNTYVLFYNSAYQSHSKYNFMMADVNTGPWFANRRDILKIPFGYRDQYYGSERLSNIIHIDPSYEHYFSSFMSTRISYSYNKEFFYSDDNTNLENDTQIYEISPSIYLGNRRHIITGALGYENCNANSRRFCYDGWYYALSFFTRFTRNTEFFIRYRRMEKSYKDAPLLYSQDREDKRDTFTAVVSQHFWKYFFASLALTYIDNNSNAELYEFDKTTYSAAIGFTF